MTSPSRRDVLKGVTSASAATGGLAMMSQPASARGSIGSRGGDQERAWSIPSKERRRRLNLLPVDGDMVRKRWDGNQPTYDESGMYAYCGSINRKDLCFWNATGCMAAATGATAYKLALGSPANITGAAYAGFLGCALPQLGCQVADGLGREGMEYRTDWIHVFGLAGPWWFRMLSSLPKWYLVALVRE